MEAVIGAAGQLFSVRQGVLLSWGKGQLLCHLKSLVLFMRQGSKESTPPNVSCNGPETSGRKDDVL